MHHSSRSLAVWIIDDEELLGRRRLLGRIQHDFKGVEELVFVNFSVVVNVDLFYGLYGLSFIDDDVDGETFEKIVEE